MLHVLDGRPHIIVAFVRDANRRIRGKNMGRLQRNKRSQVLPSTRMTAVLRHQLLSVTLNVMPHGDTSDRE